MRSSQKEDDFTKQLQANQQKKDGIRRGRARDATKKPMLQIEKPVNETQMIMVKNFRKKEHMKFIIAEILARRYPNDQVDAIDQKNAAEDELKKSQQLKN